jgi:flavin reductase (DIM6/NTAB) family NADH-FMN oxidoreductase RutF
MKEIPAMDAFSKLKPEWVFFVISVNKTGKPNGMIAARCMKCSRDPPLIAIAIGKNANTHKLIKDSREFAIAVANQDLKPYIDIFGKESGRDVDKFEKSGIATEPSRTIKSPLLRDATINFECKVEGEMDAGTSTIFLGRIFAAYLNEGKKILCNLGKGYGEYTYKEL